MKKTQFERIETQISDTAAFRISGKLGFHENSKVEHLLDECLKREYKKIIFDFSELSSLGGGVARIFRKFINTVNELGGKVKFVITNDVILDFLRDDDVQIDVYDTFDSAMSAAPGHSYMEDQGGAGEEEVDQPPQSDEDDDSVPGSTVEPGMEMESSGENASGSSTVIMMPYDGDTQAEPEIEDGDGNILSEIFESERKDSPPDWIDDPVSPFNRMENTGSDGCLDANGLTRKLKRTILELKTLFSISTDFNSIRDKRRLMDIFLLTSIAQGGVESAVFFEKSGNLFAPVMFKGVGEKALKAFNLSNPETKRITGNNDLIVIDSDSFNDEICRFLKGAGLEYFYPFIVENRIAGLIFLGKRITGRGMQEEDFEFMKILINIAQGAFENATMYEREHERTLGIVKTLISLIEENTLLKGTSEFVSRYVGMVAKDIGYPEEHFNDLIYGTVLRDMGMIKVSELIVRSPRELTREEWNVINRHPEDGADMLRRMKFNDHVVDIVTSHHERFNGEGYPRGLRGKEIPLGARIISVVESYSAMIHERPNRPALSEKEALQTLKENYGLRYDREIVKRFVKIMGKEIARSVKPASIVS